MYSSNFGWTSLSDGIHKVGLLGYFGGGNTDETVLLGANKYLYGSIFSSLLSIDAAIVFIADFSLFNTVLPVISYFSSERTEHFYKIYAICI